MLKVKRAIYKPQKKHETQMIQIQNDIKKTIKDLYLKDKKTVI